MFDPNWTVIGVIVGGIVAVTLFDRVFIKTHLKQPRPMFDLKDLRPKTALHRPQRAQRSLSHEPADHYAYIDMRAVNRWQADQASLDGTSGGERP